MASELKTTESKITTVQGQMACEVSTTHVILAIPFVLDENGKLKLAESKSGKSLMVATTHGNVNTGQRIKGSALIAGGSAYLRNE